MIAAHDVLRVAALPSWTRTRTIAVTTLQPVSGLPAA